MSDAFNESWTLLKTRRRNDFASDRHLRALQEFVDSMRGEIPADRTRMQQEFMMQMEHALDNDRWELYENIRDRAEEQLGREMANEASEFALANHLASQKEEHSSLTTVDDEELQSVIEELDEADLKSQQEERPDEIIARHARDVEMVGGEPFRDTREAAAAFEEAFGHGIDDGAYSNMPRQPITTLLEMLIHHMLHPSAPSLSLEEFQNEMQLQLGSDSTLRLTEMARERIDDMSDVEREQRRRYAEAGGSPGAAGKMLGDFETIMLELMRQMNDPTQRDGSWASNHLEETWNTVAELFGHDAANMMRERALETHAEQTRLPPDHPARIRPAGASEGSRLPHTWRSGVSSAGKDLTQLGIEEFDKNTQLTPTQRDDIRYLANLEPDSEYLMRRPPHQRTLANRRIERRGVGGSAFHLVGDDETGKTHDIASTGTSMGGPNDMSLSGLNSATKKRFRRQKAYRDLLLALLNAGFEIKSDSRNREYSNPFHTNFMQTLPPGIDVSTNIYGDGDLSVEELQRRQAIIEQGGPLAERYKRGSGSSLPIGTGDVIRYKRANMESPPSWGDLRPDLGAIPIVKPAPPPAKEPYRGRTRRGHHIDNDRQTTFNVPSNTLSGVTKPSIEQRAMGITYELPGTQGSILRPRSQLESIRYGYHPFAVDRKNVPFPAVSEQPAFADVADNMTAYDYATLYGIKPTPNEIIAAQKKRGFGNQPAPLTQDQIDAIRQLPPLAPPPPPPPPEEEPNPFDFEEEDELDRLRNLFS